MTLVLDDPRPGPSTHALIIGVGTYPYLLGGATPRGREMTEGMGQLASPPRSARAMVDWFASRHDDPASPIATIDLLLSDDVDGLTYERHDGRRFQIEWASKAAIVASIRAWRDRGDGDPDNVLHFYFCGHGVGQGFDTALLAGDFGSDEELPFQNSAIWLEGLKEGMKSCVATKQVFFVDACRVGSDRLRYAYNESLDPVIGVRRRFTPGLRQAIYYASATGAPAFGRPGLPSLFAECLLGGLNGLGANDDRGEWTVETTKLQRVLTVLADEFADPEYQGLQAPTSGEQVSFDINRMREPPIVPLYLDATWKEGDDEPPADLELVSVHGEEGRVATWPRPWEDHPSCGWQNGMFRSRQAAGLRYSWSVTFADGRIMRSAPLTLNPPFRLVRFPRDDIA